jgi:PAS domain S-box-containing protein
MRLTLSYTMMTGRVERQLDSDSELAAALSELAGTGASAISVDLGEVPGPASTGSDTQPPSRQIDPASQSISLVDARRPDRPLIYVNRGFEHLTGYTREECIGRNCRFLQGPNTDPAVVERIREATRAGEELIVDLLNYRKNGSTFWNRLSLKPVRNDAGDLTHIIGIQSDITPMIALQDMVVEWARDLGA